jgi:hypothetical protein
MTATERTIAHEAGEFWVCRDPKAFTVYRNGFTHSTADSSYEKTADGLSIAIARCDYLASRAVQ